MKDIILLLRPRQWVKNLFVFAPLFFSHQLFDGTVFLMAVIAFWAYSLVASSVYCFNDIYDVESDRLHPIKKHRPVAAGRISKTGGYAIMVICFIVGLFLGAFCGKAVVTILLFYLVMNILYCIRLKHIALVDVSIIATGFVLRIMVGGMASKIEVSQWLVLMTFLLALFIAFAKRRDDAYLYMNTGKEARRNINRYSLEFLNLMIGFIGSIVIVCYIMYTISDDVTARFESNYVYLTTVFVILGISKYMQITVVDHQSGSPTYVLFHNHFIQCCILLWVLSFLVIIYL